MNPCALQPLDRCGKCEILDVLNIQRGFMTIVSPHFRQHYIPSPKLLAGERHWMLQSHATRDLLKTILRSRSPQLGIPFFGEGAEFDFELDLVIDELGARAWPRPRTLRELFLVGLVCLKYVCRIELCGARP